MTLDTSPGFTGSRLDRADHLRDDPAAIEELRYNLRARLLLLGEGLDPQGSDDGGLSWGSLAGAPAGAPIAFLGFIDEAPRFVALNGIAGGSPRSPVLWQMLGLMPADEAATYAAARSLVDWHARHGFCARCGGMTEPIRAGWARRCLSCDAQHFPRTDPVVIMLAEHDGRVLIGRQPAFPPRFYSALAGFIEVGESLEEAVTRELKEEAGVQATSVRYIASQPWPFPSSLMIACVATVADERLTLDAKELEDAMWVTGEEVAAALAEHPAAQFIAPPPFAIANTLFRRWLAGD